MRKSIDQIGVKWRIAPDTAYLPLCSHVVELDMFHEEQEAAIEIVKNEMRSTESVAE